MAELENHRTGQSFFILSTPRACGSLLERQLNGTPDVYCGGESSELLASMRKRDAWRVPTGKVEHWRRGKAAGDEAAWHAALRAELASWTGGAAFTGVRDSFLGRESWREASDAWSWLQTVWPEAKLIFLTRADEETEVSMSYTWRLWLPGYPFGGTCLNAAMRTVRKHREWMEDYHEINPGSTVMLQASELLDYEVLSGKLGQVGIPLDRAGWEAATEVVTGESKAQARALERLAPQMTAPAEQELNSGDHGIEYHDEVLELEEGPWPEDDDEGSRWPEPFRLPVPEVTAEAKQPMVFTLRWGDAEWLRECAPTLEAWCERHGYPLHVISQIPEGLPDPKFVVVDLLREFLVTGLERVLFVDADVYVHPLAPAFPLDQEGVMCRPDIDRGIAHWRRWMKRNAGRESYGDYRPRQAGVWSCDRDSAARILAEAEAGPFIAGMMEQHQWNQWLMRAQKKGLSIVDLPQEWNRLVKYETYQASWFVHLAGGKPKEQILKRARQSKILPQVPEGFQEYERTGIPRAIVCPWLSTAASWEELRISLRSLERYFTDRECPVFVLGDVQPVWLDEFPRVQFVPCPRYEDALTMGLQLADEIVWMNDDIFFLQDTGWEDLRVALHLGPLLGRVRSFLDDANTWKKGVGRALVDLHHYGASEVWNYSTHTPYLFEREKSLATLRKYGVWRKMPFELLYHTMHGTPSQGCGLLKAWKLPISPEARFLNVTDHKLTAEMKEALRERFDTVAAT